VLPGWFHSKGATAEVFLARWFGMPVKNEYGSLVPPGDVHFEQAEGVH
jgi:hypothetical protein